MSASNDITGDSIQSKPSSQSYRDGYDRAFSKPTDAAAIKQRYTKIGTANSETFKRQEGRWIRFKMNRRGTYELFCCHERKEYYDVYSD